MKVLILIPLIYVLSDYKIKTPNLLLDVYMIAKYGLLLTVGYLKYKLTNKKQNKIIGL
jgi:hypothetical protein